MGAEGSSAKTFRYTETRVIPIQDPGILLKRSPVMMTAFTRPRQRAVDGPNQCSRLADVADFARNQRSSDVNSQVTESTTGSAAPPSVVAGTIYCPERLGALACRHEGFEGIGAETTQEDISVALQFCSNWPVLT